MCTLLIALSQCHPPKSHVEISLISPLRARQNSRPFGQLLFARMRKLFVTLFFFLSHVIPPIQYFGQNKNMFGPAQTTRTSKHIFWVFLMQN
jgi:polyferredoxin